MLDHVIRGVRRAVLRGVQLPFAHEHHQNLAEALTAEAIYDEVTGTVRNHQQVTRAHVVKERTRADHGLAGQYTDEYLRDEGRRLREEIDEDDDDQREGDVVLGMAVGVVREEDCASFLRLPQRTY